MSKEKAGVLQGGLIYSCSLEVCASVRLLQQKVLQPCATHRQDFRRETVITAGTSAISLPHSWSQYKEDEVGRIVSDFGLFHLCPQKWRKDQRQPVPHSGEAQEEARSNFTHFSLDG